MTTSTAHTIDPSLVGVYRPADPVFVRGSGSWLEDEAGRRFLDFTSGLGVTALGHGTGPVADAIRGSLDSGLIHTSNLYRTRPAPTLAAWLTEHSFADAVFFSNSGAESNEAAFKFARRWARSVGGDGKTEIVALRSSFHGRTFGALSATDRPPIRTPFEPLVPGFRIVDPGDPVALESAISAARTAAVIVEPIQGEGGVRPLPSGVAAQLMELCDAADALLIADEVQVGLGRTGQLWAHTAAGLVPDIMTLAKPLAGGLPMGATLVTRRVADALEPGDHGSTFGGGPMVATVALAVCEAVAAPSFLDGVQERARAVEERLRSLARRHSVTEVRGAGLMWGIELEGSVAGDVVGRALERGLLICSAGPAVVRLLPPLNIDPADLEAGLDMLEDSL